MGIRDWHLLHGKCIALSRRRTVRKLSDLCTILLLDPAMVSATLQDHYAKREILINSQLKESRKAVEAYFEAPQEEER